MVMSVCSLGKSAGKLSRLEAWTTALEADIYKVNCTSMSHVCSMFMCIWAWMSFL